MSNSLLFHKTNGNCNEGIEKVDRTTVPELDEIVAQANAIQETLDNAERLKEQMESLATNLSSLNGVYGGMLSAMSNRNS